MARAYLRDLFNREPAMLMATCIGVGALALPAIVVPIRRSMGLPTYQWDADVEQHPVRVYLRSWGAVDGAGRVVGRKCATNSPRM